MCASASDTCQQAGAHAAPGLPHYEWLQQDGCSRRAAALRRAAAGAHVHGAVEGSNMHVSGCSKVVHVHDTCKCWRAGDGQLAVAVAVPDGRPCVQTSIMHTWWLV